VRLGARVHDQVRDEVSPDGPAPSIELAPFATALVERLSEATPPSLALLRDGFEGRDLVSRCDQAVRLWRVGRWLATQTTRRPDSFQIIDDWTVVIGRRVVQVDADGGVRELPSRRNDQGTRLASLACWGRRR
jgi:hypothetical protein